MGEFVVDITDQYREGLVEVRVGQGMSEYVCPICGNKELRAGRFVPVPEGERAYRGEEKRLAEICNVPQSSAGSGFSHVRPCPGIMVWTPTAAANDLLGENFIIDIGNGPQKLSSLSEVRTIERDSLRRAANGEGAPLNFRALSQNRSNRDANSLKGSSYETNKQIPYSSKTQSGQQITARAKREQD